MKKITKTYYANIYLGLQEGYDGKKHNIQSVYNYIQQYCNKIKIGLTVTPTTFFYVNGMEDGAIIGLIQYPRFIVTEEELKERALTLGKKLLKKFNQERLTIVFSDITVMLEKN